MNKPGRTHLSPREKLILGSLLLPSYLLQQSIVIRVFQFAVILGLYFLQGGKFRLIPNLLLVFGIMTAYIIRPAGMVLFEIAGFPVTRGSLESGLTRALMLIGLIYLSRLSVSSKLNFKGTAGNLVGRMFYYFELITEWKGSFNFKDMYRKGNLGKLISYMDNILFSVENKKAGDVVSEKSAVSIRSYRKIVPILIFIVLSYLLLIPKVNDIFNLHY